MTAIQKPDMLPSSAALPCLNLVAQCSFNNLTFKFCWVSWTSSLHHPANLPSEYAIGRWKACLHGRGKSSIDHSSHNADRSKVTWAEKVDAVDAGSHARASCHRLSSQSGADVDPTQHLSKPSECCLLESCSRTYSGNANLHLL